MPKKNEGKLQRDNFIKAARELGCDEDEAGFDAALKKLALPSVPSKNHAKKPEQ